MIAREEMITPKLADLLSLDDAAFRQLFSGSPVKRIGRGKFLRNVLIAAGNSGEIALLGKIEALLDDADALVRGTAVWALGQLSAQEDFQARKTAALRVETDETVRSEWLLAQS